MRIKIKGKLPENPTPDDVINVILKNRNIDSTSDYFSPKHPTSLSLSDFGFEKQYIDNAMNLVWSFFESDKPIVVYSDYDADGITGGAVLWETLHTLGFKAFPYIGNRIEEGYGFSKTGLDAVKKKYDPALIISVDHGIAAREMVKYAKQELNIPIIVTDHHHRQEDKVPDCAEAIFHIPALSGSGTAYYVAKQIAGYRVQGIGYSEKSKDKINETTPCTLAPMPLSELFASDYIGLAAIGTIADLVPLVGPSRAIAKYGLEALTKTKRAGIEALKEVSGNLGKTITTYEVGFMIAPRINASGRLADALTALRLLCTKDAGKANAIAQKLQALNVERQDMVKKAVEEAISIVEKMRDKDGELPKILIVMQNSGQLSEVSSPRFRLGEAGGHSKKQKETDDCELTTDNSPASQAWHEGIIGLIASKLVEKYHRPAIVLTKQKNSKQLTVNKKQEENNNDQSDNCNLTTDNYFKASARSIYGFHLTNFLKKFEEYLLHFGGHAAAAGLSISGKNISIFIEKATSAAEEDITEEMLSPTMEVDCDLPLSCINMELVQKIETLEPFGVGNEKPKFVSTGEIADIQIFGKDNNHLRFNLKSGKFSLPFIAFGKADIVHELTSNIKVAFYLDLNRWNGTEKLQAKLVSKVTS